MRRIFKLPEPLGLRKYKATASLKHSYEDGSDCFVDYKKCTETESEFCYESANENENEKKDSAFDELRKQLLKEQKYVCCYCGQAIKKIQNNQGSPLMKTEHFAPKKGENAQAHLQLEYSNLFAVCLGNQNSAGEKHCDSKKGDLPLVYIKNPATSSFLTVFEYRVLPNQKKVTVHAKKGIAYQSEIEQEINKVLNLNEQSLAQRRFSYWKREIEDALRGKWTKPRLEALIAEFEGSNVTHHKDFSDFILQYLSQKIKTI
ncbi:MAG: hypothetical protein ACKVTZ_10110 [Bacteroidia bacterium]